MSIEIGNNLSKLRKEKGLTQEGLANLADINNVMISRYENGDKEMTIDTLVKVAKALGTSLDYIVFGKGEKVIHYKKEEQTEGEKIARSIIVLLNNRLLEESGYGDAWYLTNKYKLWDYTKNMQNIINDDDAYTEGYTKFLETKIRNYANKIDAEKSKEDFLPDY